MQTSAKQRVRRLAFARLGELDVLDEIVQDLFLLRTETSIVGLVPVEVENACGNAMGNVVLVRILTFMARLVLSPISAKNVLKLALELRERV